MSTENDQAGSLESIRRRFKKTKRDKAEQLPTNNEAL